LKISEVIAELEKLKTEHGDIPMVVRWYDQFWEEVGDVTVGSHYFMHHGDGGNYKEKSATLTP
jgi:hypothetical protein